MSDKKLHTLTIDPEFRDLIPPLNDDELTMLEESIVANGCESPLIVWNGVIVDGHNRHAICQKHNIPFAVTEKEFSSREDAMLWMLRNQLGRRNLNSYQRSDLVLKLEPLMASEAKLRKGQRTDLGQNSAPGSQMGKTSHKLAEMAGVSHDTIKKVKKLNEAADEETKGKLRRGEVTVHKAYTELMQKEHGNEKRICDRCKQEKPVAAFSIPAKAAAEVASATTAKVETHPINGMAMLNGAPIHVTTPLPDEPAMLPHVMSTLETAAHSFLATVETSLHLMTRGIATPENLRIYEEALLSIADQAHELFKNHVKEIEKR